MSSKFKWKIVEYNGTEQAIVDYCKNFMTSVCTYGKNGKNKLFTPPNPYIDYNNDYSFSYYEEQQDVEYKRRGDLAFKAVKDGYADIVLTTIPEKYSHSNFCVYFAPAKFLDEKIGKEINKKFNSIFGDITFHWMIRTCFKENPNWNVCINGNGFITSFETREKTDSYVKNMIKIAEELAYKSSRITFDQNFEDYIGLRNSDKRFYKRYGGFELLNAFIDYFKNKGEAPYIEYQCTPDINVDEYVDKIKEIMKKYEI